MFKQQAVNYFGNKVKLAKAIGVSPASITGWGEKIPKLRAYQLQVITNGALKAEDSNLHNTSINGLIKNEQTITD